jgi:hypothetical protein
VIGTYAAILCAAVKTLGMDAVPLLTGNGCHDLPLSLFILLFNLAEELHCFKKWILIKAAINLIGVDSPKLI